MQTTLEIHLRPAPLGDGHEAGPGEHKHTQAPLRLGFQPTALGGDADTVMATTGSPRVVLEPFFNQHQQPRLLAEFAEAAEPMVNGEPAPRIAVLIPGDRIQWQPGLTFQVALHHTPRIGPPPPEVIGKPCPFCRLPFKAESTVALCACGAYLHLEPEGPSAFRCATEAPQCPTCQRRVALEPTYLTPTSDEH